MVTYVEDDGYDFVIIGNQGATASSSSSSGASRRRSPANRRFPC
jgi:hypothetical protein